MSVAVLEAAPGSRAARASSARVALLGTGNVGRAVLARLHDVPSLGQRLHLVHVANSRRALGDVHGLAANAVHDALAKGHDARLGDVDARLQGSDTRIVIDATASQSVADLHAHWLKQGIHVVTACKLGQGTQLASWHAIRAATAQSGSAYGDSATVGAGLPLLHTLRQLQAGGDRIHAIAGVLSGSLGWLFNQFDGMRPFSSLVRQAREAGYTEPDPRDDLSGEDVRRKLLILARACGVALEQDQVEVESLVPEALRALSADCVDEALPALDAPLRERYAQAHRNGERLRFVAEWRLGQARVGLKALPVDHALCGGAGTDNRVAIWCDRYPDQPLLIQGPGAGAGVTAAALIDDALRILG